MKIIDDELIDSKIKLSTFLEDVSLATDFDDKNYILEAFKEKDINNLSNKQLISNYNYDKLIKFRQFY